MFKDVNSLEDLIHYADWDRLAMYALVVIVVIFLARLRKK